MTKTVDYVMPKEARQYNRDRVAKWRRPFYEKGMTYKKVKGRWRWVPRRMKTRKQK